MFSSFIQKMRFFTYLTFNSRSKADIIKSLNYENKTLFGPVKKIKKKSKKNVQNDKTKSDTKDNNIRINNTSINNKSSEIYWLIQSKQQNQKNLEIFPIKKSDEPLKFKTKNLSTNIKKSFTKRETATPEFVNNIKLNSNINCETVEETKKEVYIPFDEKGLRNIIYFPLIFDNNNFKVGNNLVSDETNVVNSAKSNFKLPSVNKILQSTMPDIMREALMKWKLKKISELGESGFENLQKENLLQGKLFHEALQKYLVFHEKPEINPCIEGVWSSVETALNTIKPETKLIEAPVEHPFLKYCGVIDYVSTIKSNLCVVEWKKSDKIKNTINSTYDAPLQLSAYLGALSHDPKYKLNAKFGLIVVAYTNGEPANVHQISQTDLHNYWFLWLKRLQEYWIRLKDGTLQETI